MSKSWREASASKQEERHKLNISVIYILDFCKCLKVGVDDVADSNIAKMAGMFLDMLSSTLTVIYQQFSHLLP